MLRLSVVDTNHYMTSLYWSRRRESNPYDHLGKVEFYHWTTTTFWWARAESNCQGFLRGFLRPLCLPISSLAHWLGWMGSNHRIVSSKLTVLPLDYAPRYLEPYERIELSTSAWKAEVLPLNEYDAGRRTWNRTTLTRIWVELCPRLYSDMAGVVRIELTLNDLESFVLPLN